LRKFAFAQVDPYMVTLVRIKAHTNFLISLFPAGLSLGREESAGYLLAAVLVYRYNTALAA
jgi:hypothetical protein